MDVIEMKYFLVFILSCLNFAHSYTPRVRPFFTYFSDVQPIATDRPLDFTQTTKHAQFEPSTDTSGSKPLIGFRSSNNGFKVSTSAFKIMATIRESPSEVYLCSATFITKEVLLTTARCLIGHDTDKIFVHSNSSNLETQGPGNLGVKNVHLHPDFDMSPVNKDFAIITLQKPVDYITPLLLPNKKIGKIGSVGTSYTWRFTSSLDKFLIHEHQSKIISNAKCFLIEQETIPEDMACATGFPSQDGHYDNGMPFIINKKGKSYLFGINHISSTVLTEKVEKVWRVDKIVPWITDTLREENTKRKKQTTQKPSVANNDENNVNAEDNDDEDDDDEEEEEERKEEDREDEHM